MQNLPKAGRGCEKRADRQLSNTKEKRSPKDKKKDQQMSLGTALVIRILQSQAQSVEGDEGARDWCVTQACKHTLEGKGGDGGRGQQTLTPS